MNLNDIEQYVKSCTRCPLYKTRNSPVIGEGNSDADILIVSEAPGYNEDLEGKPFIGQSGKLLDEILLNIGLDRQKDIYITNILKCHPPGNRNPELLECEACMPYLRVQYTLIKPKIVVCLGRIAAQNLISPDFKITKQHGIFFEKKGVNFIATFHPSAILRNPSNRNISDNDFKIIKQKYDEIRAE